MSVTATKDEDIQKVCRLIEYLIRLAEMSKKQVRDIQEYQKILWINDVPRHSGCYSRYWGDDEKYESDVWLEVKNKKEPPLPAVPIICKDWIEQDKLRNKDDLPELLPQIELEKDSLSDSQLNNQSKVIRLNDHPEVQKEWDYYIENEWFPWAEKHNEWLEVHKVYSNLFAIHQEQIRLGEKYELIIGLGLFTWKNPSGQSAKRHLIVANASLEFEARLEKFTVRPSSDGPKIRLELDMIEPADLPVNPEAEKELLEAIQSAGDELWEGSLLSEALQTFLNHFPSRVESVGESSKPVIQDAPALILRDRSVKDLTDILNRMKEQIENGLTIPSEFLDVSEIKPKTGTYTDKNEIAPVYKVIDEEIYFPKPSNEEQRQIVEKLRFFNGVLVQGPPGTGKSHTISNLICHLLAEGKRILVTAKTSHALKVLAELVHPKISNLCINILGSGREEKNSLESSVQGILNMYEEWNEDVSQKKIKTLESSIRKLREEKAEIDRRIRAIRESETHTHSVVGGIYQGTATQIAKDVSDNKCKYDWFEDITPLGTMLPFSEEFMITLLNDLRYFTKEKSEKLNLELPYNLPSTEVFRSLVENELEVAEEVRNLESKANKDTSKTLSAYSTEIIERMKISLLEILDKQCRIKSVALDWMICAMRDVMNDDSLAWQELHRMTSKTINKINDLVNIADDNRSFNPQGYDLSRLFDDAKKLKEHIDNGRSLGWWIFRSKPVKDRLYLLKNVRINGDVCCTSDSLSTLIDVLIVHIDLEIIWELWEGKHEKPQALSKVQISELKSIFSKLESVLELRNLVSKCQEMIKECPELTEPIWSDEPQTRTLIESCNHASKIIKKRNIENRIKEIEIATSSLVLSDNSHPITQDILKAIQDRDINAFTKSKHILNALIKDKELLEKTEDNLSRLNDFLPKLTDNLRKTSDNDFWYERLRNLREAWQWNQARYWIEEYIKKDDLPVIMRRCKDIEDEIQNTIAELSSLKAWSFCFSRLTETHQRHMQSWQKAMKRLGKGTGKYAPIHRREAQEHLKRCYEAVPAWVMPLHRVWNTIEPEPAMFDVVIIDEASQCGFEALPLFYLAKKIIVVGDDKQISPEVGFTDKSIEIRWMKDLLFDFDYPDVFYKDSSVFDHAQLRYGSRKIVLREHFRCMPEIIRFSNDLCYSDTPLIPLRQYGSNRLNPLENYFVSTGYREGPTSRPINRPEAEMLVRKVEEICKDKRYDGKSIGIIVLQGQSQIGVIEELLLNKLTARAIEERRIKCGNPYHFQGDERDVILLSLVAASNERIGTLTKLADERRFNVAASRAKDQMILFHSVTSDDLSKVCLRRKLLDFFQHTEPDRIGGIKKDELERIAYSEVRNKYSPPEPFDSWFEVDVALEISRKKYRVIPQYEIIGKRIDLVIDGGISRLAVECDGDTWHDMDSYDSDMLRQRQLERCGWEFFRVRSSSFYANRITAMQGLWSLLEERGIYPVGVQKETKPKHTESYHKNDIDEPQIQKKRADVVEGHVNKNIERVSERDIQEIIVKVLKNCPNNSCTIDSMTSRVLKELNIITRGNPRVKFQKRVLSNINKLDNEGQVEKYRAKNHRVRLGTVQSFPFEGY